MTIGALETYSRCASLGFNQRLERTRRAASSSFASGIPARRSTVIRYALICTSGGRKYMAKDEPTTKHRISITKNQRQTEIAIELISLCQTYTEDGTVSDEEIHGLGDWLGSHRSSDIPAIGFLVTTIEKVLADGVITKEERASVYKAIEAILPLDLRRDTTSRRRMVEEQERDRERSLREEEKQKKREETARNRRQGSCNFMVAGVRHENREAIVSRHVSEEDTAYLRRDRANRFSRNAVEVRAANGMMIGYVPEDYAIEVAPLLDQGCRHEALFTKVLRGGRVPIPVVQAYFYGPDATVPSAITQAEIPTKEPDTGAVARAVPPWRTILAFVIVLVILYVVFVR
jgi:hypothetical protein